MDDHDEMQPNVKPAADDGPFILVLGIVGLFMQPLGPAAWIWGNRALKRAEPSQRGLIQAGRILGIIGTALLTISVIVGIGYYFFMMTVFAPMFRNLGISASSTSPAATTPATHSYKTVKPHPPWMSTRPTKAHKPPDFPRDQ